MKISAVFRAALGRRDALPVVFGARAIGQRQRRTAFLAGLSLAVSASAACGAP